MVAWVVDLQRLRSLSEMLDAIGFDSMLASIVVGMSIALQSIAVDHVKWAVIAFAAYLVVEHVA